MHLIASLSMIAGLSLTSLALPAPADTAIDYGYWNVNVTWSSAASGYLNGEVYGEYSGEPGQINTFTWRYNPMTKSTTTVAVSSFNSSIVEGEGEQAIDVQQTVVLSGANVTIVGSSTVDMTCGLGGAGDTCEGSTTITATPVS